MLRIKGQKGELTTKQLVTIIILIVSFIIILFLVFRLNLGETTNKEICRNSVILAGKSPFAKNLDCKTNYLCIFGGGNCKVITATPTYEIDLSNAKNEIMKAIADEMSDCWWQFGEGKVNYGTPQGISVKYALCSIIEFDDKVQGKISEISYQEFYDYLKTTKKDNSQSYLNYLYDINDVNSLEIQSQIKINIKEDKIKTEERYSIITGIDDNLSPYPDEFLKVYLIPTSETSLRLAADKEFITKV